MGIYGRFADNLLEISLNNMCNSLNNEVILFTESEILTEGTILDSFKKIMDKVKEFIQKIKKIFNSLILNFNRIKSAKLPKQQNEDLEKVLKVMQPRTLEGIKELITVYKDLSKNNKDVSKEEIKDGDIKRNQGPDEYSMDTSIRFEADKTIVDIKESLEAVEKLKEYERLNKNEYNKDNIETIPLNNIVNDIKDCLKQVDIFEKELNDIENINNNIDEDKPEIKKVSTKMVKLCQDIIKYYNFRIKILNIYFKSAKVSVKAIKNLFGNKIDFGKTSTNVEGGVHKKIILNNVDAFKLSDLVGKLQEANTEKEYTEYKKIHSELTSLLKVPDGNTITILNSIPENGDPDDNWEIEYQYFNNSYEKIPVGGRPLYHHCSENVDLEDLKPTAVGNWGKTYYPEPRIYVHINVILNKAGKKLDKKWITNVPNVEIDPETFEISTTYEKQVKYLFENRNVYRIDEDIEYVYKDSEMGGTGTFIISEKPIKLKKVDYNQWKKENDFD